MTEDKKSLEELKEKYKILEKKYNLPSFGKLNEDFQIEKAAEIETDFLLREVRRYIMDRFFYYLRFIESLINPVNSPMFVFALVKTLGIKEKERLNELYKKIAKIELDILELDLQYSEEKEVKSIKEYFDIWNEIKSELFGIVNIMKKNWDIKLDDNGKGYFG